MLSEELCSDLMVINLHQTCVNLMDTDNRRFMYHPSGWLILGAEGTVSRGKLHSSHSEEHYEAKKICLLPEFDEFIRGWIGVGGSYRNGIIHFAPAIPAENIEMFEKAFDFIEAALCNGFSEKAILRGFPGAWEQAISNVIPKTKSVDFLLEDALMRSIKNGPPAEKEQTLGG